MSFLTTAQGLRLRDTDHSLKAGERGPDAAGGLPPAREDHPLRPRAHPRARGARARAPARTACSRPTATPPTITRRRLPRPKVSRRRCSSRFSTVLGLARLGRHGPRHPRVRGEVLHRRGQLRPRRQQHPGVLHPGRHQVPRRHPRRQAAPGPRDPAGADAPTTRSGTSCPCTPRPTHHVDLDHVRPRHPALVPDDGGLRRPHLPARQRRRARPSLVKFHWKPVLGVHSLVWEEAQMLAGDRPRLPPPRPADAIEAGAFPQWELGVQVLADNAEQTFEGIDLLDPTKLVPEELAPVQPIGLLTLNRNPTNYFAETEQVAFHVGQPGAGHRRHRRPADAGPAVLLPRHPAHPPGRPELRQIPINRPHAPVNDMLRDGFHQDAVHGGVAPYRPNSRRRRVPVPRRRRRRRVRRRPRRGRRARRPASAPASFDDHFSQVRQFWLQHDAGRAGPHRLGVHLRARQVLRAGHPRAAARGAGERRPRAVLRGWPPASVCLRPTPTEPLVDYRASARPSRRSVAPSLPTVARSGSSSTTRPTTAAVDALSGSDPRRGIMPLVVGPHAGTLASGLPVQRTFAACRSVEFDAVLVAGASWTRSSRCCSRSASGTPRRSVPGAPGPRPWPAPGSTGTPWVWSPEPTATTCGHRCTR